VLFKTHKSTSSHSWPIRTGKDFVLIQVKSFFYLLGTSFVKDIRPMVWIIELTREHWSKVCIGESRFEAGVHKFPIGWVWFGFLPRFPEPLRPKARHWKHTPMNEDAHFGFIIPSWNGACIQTLPGWLVLTTGTGTQQGKQCQYLHVGSHISAGLTAFN